MDDLKAVHSPVAPLHSTSVLRFMKTMPHGARSSRHRAQWPMPNMFQMFCCCSSGKSLATWAQKASVGDEVRFQFIFTWLESGEDHQHMKAKFQCKGHISKEEAFIKTQKS